MGQGKPHVSERRILDLSLVKFLQDQVESQVPAAAERPKADTNHQHSKYYMQLVRTDSNFKTTQI